MLLVPAFGGAPLLTADTDRSQWVALSLGLVGGLLLGQAAYHHLFVEGIEPAEKKGLLIFAVSALGLWGVQQVFDMDKAVEDLGAQITSAIARGGA